MTCKAGTLVASTATGSSIGNTALLIAAKTIAASAIDLYQDPARLQRRR